MAATGIDQLGHRFEASLSDDRVAIRRDGVEIAVGRWNPRYGLIEEIDPSFVEGDPMATLVVLIALEDAIVEATGCVAPWWESGKLQTLRTLR